MKLVSAVVKAQTQGNELLLLLEPTSAASTGGGAELRRRGGVGEGGVGRRHGEDLVEEVVAVTVRWVVGHVGE